MNIQMYKKIDLLWQTLSFGVSIWILANIWQIGLMVFFIAMGLAQTTSLLVHIMSKDVQITLVRKWLYRGFYLAFALLMLQIVIMQLSAVTGYVTLIAFGTYVGLLMLGYYVNTWAEIFDCRR